MSSLAVYLDSVKSSHPNSRSLLLGDFNMPDIKWDEGNITDNIRPFEREFLSILTDNNMIQTISEPTHVKGNTLDLLCSDLGGCLYDTVVIQPGLSDHFMISASIICTTSKSEIRKRQVRLFAKADRQGFHDDLEKLHCSVIGLMKKHSDIDLVWDTVRNGFHQAVDKNVPSKTCRIKPPHEPFWFNLEAKKACTKQKRLYRSYKKYGDQAVLAGYKVLRKANKKLFRKLKSRYFENKLYDPLKDGDTKPFYRHIKNLRGGDNTIHSIETSPGVLSQDKLTMANTLNNYFHSVFSNAGSSLPLIHCQEDRCMTITKEGVLKLLVKLKSGKAPGPDHLTKEILCLDSDKCSEILVDFFNLSITTGTLPAEWKTANVTPIFKAGSRTNPTNYRPVSLTSICCKLLEHIVLHYLSPRLNDLLFTNQHGFRSSMSCNTQLITVVHDVALLLDTGSEVHGAVLDFSKAFDLVPHQSLIDKLIKYSINPVLTRWIADFLANRSQSVVLSGVRSCSVPVTSGVPQGSVLGPSLFLLYINDIVESVNHSHIRLFADDTLLYKSIKNQNDSNLFQRDLDSLSQWSVQNSMRFNASKSNIIVFTSKRECRDPFYTLGTEPLTTTDSVKYLGVSFQRNLKWDGHINATLNKASRVLGLLKHTLFDAPVSVKEIGIFYTCQTNSSVRSRRVGSLH
jgi:hypothetical protein